MAEEVIRPPLWYKDAVIYEVHVRAFADSNADGIGDFPGLTSRLDYLSQLGVNAIWLLPFYPSPLKDDGYDIADYYDVHPSYGTLDDFRTFLHEAHSRNMRVITELVINHTSDQHPWFQRARRAELGTPERDFYVWGDDPDAMSDVRIIFQDTETSNWAWDSVANAYYWHRFFSHQPDLNYDNPLVRESVTDVLRFWLDMGVDGVRLDAVPYLYERDGTNAENLEETHQELKRLRAFVDEHYDNRMLLAEANQWPEDSVAYFGDGDECHMAFHFPLMPRLYLALQRESRMPIIDILEQTPDLPDTSQWAIFLRNHDELTLEMVTEEDRDFMWRTYAPDRRARINLGIRRRLAPLMEGDRRRIELLHSLLLSLPGTPVLYYGDEIGMGDNIFLPDRDGVRTPMQWSSDRNAGFSRANPQSLYMPVVVDPQFHYETVNVDAQQANPNSLLSWVRRMLERRRRHSAFGQGTIEFLYPDNDKVLAYVRRGGGDTILVVVNLSSDAQYVELDLSQFDGLEMTELLGGTDFPAIGKLPYLLTLSPYGFYWFTLGAGTAGTVGSDEIIPLGESIDDLFAQDQPLPALIGRYIARQPWFQSRDRRRVTVHMVEHLPLESNDPDLLLWLALVDLVHNGNTPDRYVIPLALALDDRSVDPDRMIARVEGDGRVGVAYDALAEPAFQETLLDGIVAGKTILGRAGSLVCSAPHGLGMSAVPTGPAEIEVASGEIYMSYGRDIAVKLFPRVEPGLNPDLELRRFLTERTAFDDLADVYGSLEYQSGDTFTLGVMQQSYAGAPNAWAVFEEECDAWLGSIKKGDIPAQPSVGAWAQSAIPPLLPAPKTLQKSLRRAAQLAQTTADLHLGLGSLSEDPDIGPQPFTTLYQRALYQSLRTSIRNTLSAIRRMLPTNNAGIDEALQEVLHAEGTMLERIDRIRRIRMSGRRIRLHGDYRLDAVRLVDDRFMLVDLSGDHRRPMSERRLRASPLRDVSEMVRSLDYLAIASSRKVPSHLSPWGHWWSQTVGVQYVRSYLAVMEESALLPDDRDAIDALLQAYTLARGLRELQWELEVRNDWVPVALAGVRRMLDIEPALVD